MDAARKAHTERWIIIGLLGLFLVVFVTGPMKTLGWFRPAAPVEPPVGKVPMAKPLGTVLERLRNRMEADTQVESAAGRGAQAQAPPKTVPAYTAGELRDPFISLLPEPPHDTQTAGAAAPAAPGPNSAPATRAPPTLRVEGVVWGGAAPSAIIDGTVYRLGESVQSMRIVSIDREGVTVDYAGDRLLYPPVSVAPGQD
jgi:hypothetical protein